MFTSWLSTHKGREEDGQENKKREQQKKKSKDGHKGSNNASVSHAYTVRR